MMKRQADRYNFKNLQRGLRKLWNEYDPIGIMGDPEWPRDEYDVYVIRSLKLLMNRASWQEHQDYIRHAHENMDISFNENKAEQFAKKIRYWWFNRLDGERKFESPNNY